MIDPVESFVNDLKSIEDSDYGDFMRKANSYLNVLEQDLIPLDMDVRAKLFEMKLYLQYLPSVNTEGIRELIIRDARYINDLLLAHKQDWES